MKREITYTLKLKGIKKAKKKAKELTKELKKTLKAYKKLKSLLSD